MKRKGEIKEKKSKTPYEKRIEAGKKNLEKNKIKKGEVRNPKGRPKGARNSKTILREMLNIKEMLKDEATQQYVTKTRKEWLFDNLTRKAIDEGDVRKIELILKMIDEMPATKIENKIEGNLDIANLKESILDLHNSAKPSKKK